jgi:SHS2 domain-containing protein
MPYRYLEDIAIADLAFEAEGRTLEEVFQASAAALTNAMVQDVKTIDADVVKRFCIEGDDAGMLLYHFLQELVFFKDSERLFFQRHELDIGQGIPAWHMHVQAFGEEINPRKHELLADVKAVSLHNFSVRGTPGGWKASVIIDV